MLARRYSVRFTSRSCASVDPLIDVKVPMIPVPARPGQTASQQATDCGTEYPAGHGHASVAQLDCSRQQCHPVVPLAHVHRKFPSYDHAARVSLISFRTAFSTMSLAAELFVPPPRCVRRKCFRIARRAGVPHVNGDLVSRTPFRIVSASPEHGRVNSRDPSPLLRDHRTVSTPAGPGVNTISFIGPCTKQSPV